MRQTFLEYVAKDLDRKFGHNLSRIVVVFPNKRAALFMNEYLARMADRPIWSPRYTTISDLFRHHASLEVADPIKLVCDLYHSFVEVTGTDETLDHFYGWGQLLLADFDDIDKNMAAPHKVFANLKDLHELDNTDYLSDEQKEILKRFFSNFTDDHDTELKKRFMNLWARFGEIYDRFNTLLAQQGLAYEGRIYREVATNEQLSFEYDKYIFVGFNVLQRAEQQLFRHLQGMDKALFYWDYDRYYLQGNEAGHYIHQYIQQFPNELTDTDGELYNQFGKYKRITYIAATTENAQARYVTEWLRENHRIADGRKTAIVLCDESLLQAVIHSLPPEVEKVNVTTGFPLAQSPAASLVDMMVKVQTQGHIVGTDKYRLSFVKSILTHPYIPYLSEKYADLLDDLERHKRFYPTRKQLAVDEGLGMLFADLEDGDTPFNLRLTQWMLDILKRIGAGGKDEEDPFFQESVFRTHTLVNRLATLIADGDLKIDLVTLERLIGQLIASTQIPFHGEPAVGLQIMGVLETRNLDFEHVLVLSCNEGNMPKGVNDASFIPHSIRKAHGLTTIDNKVAIYAYYFHRLLQRATDITLLYNNATEDGHTGEMSRFMLQMLVESRHQIRQLAIQTGQTARASQPVEVEKTEGIMERLDQVPKLSPTAINRYLFCPLSFYYNVVEGIKEPDEEDEDKIDSRVFGNIFHRSAELVYTRMTANGNTITESAIKELLAHPEQIEIIVDRVFREELFNINDPSFRPEYNGLQLINRGVVISYLHQLLKIDCQLAPFTIKGLELEVADTLTFSTPRGTREIGIHGIIDRLDEIETETDGRRIRVIDYKTGKLPTRKTYAIDEIFSGEAYQQKHTNYYLQTLLYALIVSHDRKLNPGQLPVSPALIFIQHTSARDYDPTLMLDKEKMVRATDYELPFREGLEQVLQNIFNPALPFSPTSDGKRCESCVYRQLCRLDSKKV